MNNAAMPSRPSIASRGHFRRTHPGRRAGAFSLVEVTLALGLVAFCLVALLGLLQAGLRQDRASIDQTLAAHILDAVKSEFRGHMRRPETVPADAAAPADRFHLKVPDLGGGDAEGTFALNDEGNIVANPQEKAYVVHYEIEAPGGTDGVYLPYCARIVVAWPGAAEFSGNGAGLSLQKAGGQIEATLALNRQ